MIFKGLILRLKLCRFYNVGKNILQCNDGD